MKILREVLWVLFLAAVFYAFFNGPPLVHGQTIDYAYKVLAQQGLQDLNIHGDLLAYEATSEGYVSTVMARKTKMAPTDIHCNGPFDDTVLRRLNNPGDSVGSCLNAAHTKETGVIRTNAGDLSFLDFPGADGTIIETISDQRKTCGRYYTPATAASAFTRMHGFCSFKQSRFETVDIPLDHSVTTVSGISKSGKRVLNYFTYDPVTNETGQYHCVMLDNGIYTSLERPGATFSYCSDMNNDDVVLYEDDHDVFLLDDGVYFKITPPVAEPGFTVTQLNPTGINDALEFTGEVVQRQTTGCTGLACRQIRQNVIGTPR